MHASITTDIVHMCGESSFCTPALSAFCPCVSHCVRLGFHTVYQPVWLHLRVSKPSSYTTRLLLRSSTHRRTDRRQPQTARVRYGSCTQQGVACRKPHQPVVGWTRRLQHVWIPPPGVFLQWSAPLEALHTASTKKNCWCRSRRAFPSAGCTLWWPRRHLHPQACQRPTSGQ